MLTVVAAGMIARFIVPMVSNNLEGSSKCLPYKEYFYFEEEFGYNCYTALKDSDGMTVSRLYGISVGANTIKEEDEEKIAGFRLMFVRQGDSNAVEVANDIDSSREDNKISMLNSSMEKIIIPRGGEVRTYVYNTTNIIEEIRLYPMLKEGDSCDPSDSIKVAGIICEVDIQ